MSALVGFISKERSIPLIQIGSALDVTDKILATKPFNVARDHDGSRLGIAYKLSDEDLTLPSPLDENTTVRKDGDWVIIHGHIGPDINKEMPSTWIRELGLEFIQTQICLASLSLVWGNKLTTAPLEMAGPIVGAIVGRITDMIENNEVFGLKNWMQEFIKLKLLKNKCGF